MNTSRPLSTAQEIASAQSPLVDNTNSTSYWEKDYSVKMTAQSELYSPAMLTDMYEYTMLDATLRDGTANRQCVFEVFARHLPAGRRYGVTAGLGRILAYLQDFKPSASDLQFLADHHIVSRETIHWLENFEFHGTIHAYREGEIYFPHSPILQIEGTFGECTLLETLILSILNYDSAVATAASRMTAVANGRPCYDMGGRRIHEQAAIAASRAAVIGGFAGTANLAAAKIYDIPVIGTAAHAFTLVHDTEREAFSSQIQALGTNTALLTDTYNIEHAITTAIEVAGTNLGGIRIDSGDLASTAQKARHQLDTLGAVNTTITVTNDLDEYAIAALQAAPIDAYGIGTRLVTGSGHPTCEMVYKLVERENSTNIMQPVAKKSFGKTSDGWRKLGMRSYLYGLAQGELVVVGPQKDLDTFTPSEEYGDVKNLMICAVDHGNINTDYLGNQAIINAQAYHREARATLPITALSLSQGEPVIPTCMIHTRHADSAQ